MQYLTNLIQIWIGHFVLIFALSIATYIWPFGGSGLAVAAVNIGLSLLLAYLIGKKRWLDYFGINLILGAIAMALVGIIMI